MNYRQKAIKMYPPGTPVNGDSVKGKYGVTAMTDEGYQVMLFKEKVDAAKHFHYWKENIPNITDIFIWDFDQGIAHTDIRKPDELSR